MPYYWAWLYRPRRQQETEQDRILRRLSFKLPVVLRYNMLFAFVFGVLHASLNGRPRVVISYFKLIPLGIAALCYQEILDYYNYKVNLEKQGSVTVE